MTRSATAALGFALIAELMSGCATSTSGSNELIPVTALTASNTPSATPTPPPEPLDPLERVKADSGSSPEAYAELTAKVEETLSEPRDSVASLAVFEALSAEHGKLITVAAFRNCQGRDAQAWSIAGSLPAAGVRCGVPDWSTSLEGVLAEIADRAVQKDVAADGYIVIVFDFVNCGLTPQEQPQAVTYNHPFSVASHWAREAAQPPSSLLLNPHSRPSPTKRTIGTTWTPRLHLVRADCT